MLRFYANVADCADLFDYVLHCETLADDLDAMLGQLDITPPFKLRRWNTTDKTECSTRLVYDDDEKNEMLVAMLGDYCARFGYPTTPQ